MRSTQFTVNLYRVRRLDAVFHKKSRTKKTASTRGTFFRFERVEKWQWRSDAWV